MTIENTNVSRRTLVKGAAWSLPVVAVAAATPLAAASTSNANVDWTGNNSGLLQLDLLDEGGVITAAAVVTVPDEYTITNGTGAISNEVATVTIAVGTPSGINISLGHVRGFGVVSVDGIATSDAERNVNYASAFGFPTTTWTGTRTVNIASNGSLVVPVVFGLAGESTSLLDVSLLATFPVNLTVEFADGSSYLATSSISVLANAGIL
ncbi:MAG: hypothetical protein BGN97_11220 [Microbacterium sp. 69-10]|uniref:hypothetical protein n=1 Tax=Microbacterium sp. 69-10 TaxID=1895783 RepID=UPI00095D45B9|nr:hypothetical protein [Microbacterium sp. 69-10]OJU40405.1 MAG: hypothetical protein BGN97_11220 [Microbacterium sp. 69-10]